MDTKTRKSIGVGLFVAAITLLITGFVGSQNGWAKPAWIMALVLPIVVAYYSQRMIRQATAEEKAEEAEREKRFLESIEKDKEEQAKRMLDSLDDE